MIYTIDQIRRIAAPIAAAYGVKSVRLFGSYARGEATEHSDVDLLVDRGSVRSGFALGGLYADLRDSLHKELDLVTTQGATAEFLARIHPDEVLIYDTVSHLKE